MPKVTIEIDLPEGQAIPRAEDILRLTDPDWIASWWSIDDVKEVYLGDEEWEMLTDEEAREVLRLADKYHDADVGLNWDVFSSWADHVYAQRKKVA
jgi:phage gp46-like protein